MNTVVEKAKRDVKEDLLDSLQPYFRDGTVNHPIISMKVTTPRGAAKCNEEYRRAIDKVKIAKFEKDWLHYVRLHRPAYRLEAILNLRPELDEQWFLEMLEEQLADDGAKSSSDPSNSRFVVYAREDECLDDQSAELSNASSATEKMPTPLVNLLFATLRQVRSLSEPSA